MRALADALAEEHRSVTLAQRSRELLRAYGGKPGVGDGADLEQTGRFAAALGALASDADQAVVDASAQARWEMETLGRAQSRKERQSERLQSALADRRALKQRREAAFDPHTASPRLARNVQGSQDNSGEGPKPSSIPALKRNAE